MVRLSVIVATYRPGPEFARLLASLDAQTLPQSDFEVLVVDDGSPADEHAELVATVGARANHRVLRIENSGWPSRPRNVGLAEATGEFVTFSDQDDTFFPDAFTSALAVADRTGADVVNPKEVRAVDPLWGLGTFSRPDLDESAGPTALVPMTARKLYRRTLLTDNAVQFPDEPRHLWEDVFFNIGVFAHAHHIAISQAPFYRWEHTGSNASGDEYAKDFATDPDHYWRHLERLLTHVETTLAGERLDAARRQQLVLHLRLRILRRLDDDFLDLPDDVAQHVLTRGSALVDRFAPAEFERQLVPSDRARLAVLRLGDLAVAREMLAAERGFTGAVTVEQVRDLGVARQLAGMVSITLPAPGDTVAEPDASGTWWRAYPPAVAEHLAADARRLGPEALRPRVELVATDLETRATWRLGVALTKPLQPQRGTSDTFAWHLTCDLSRVAAGAPLPPGDWRVVAWVSYLGRSTLTPPDPAEAPPLEQFTALTPIPARPTTPAAPPTPVSVPAPPPTSASTLSRWRRQDRNAPTPEPEPVAEPAPTWANDPRAGIRLDPLLLAALDDLDLVGATRTVVVHGSGAKVWTQACRRMLPDATVHTLARELDEPLMHDQLLAIGEIDLVIDGTGRADTIQTALRHLSPEGVYVAAKVKRAGTLRIVEKRAGDTDLDDSFRTFRSGRHGLVLLKLSRHVASVAPEEFASVAAERWPDHRVSLLGHRPAVELPSRARLSSNDPELTASRLPQVMRAPELFTTVHEDVVCGLRGVQLLDNLMLPTAYHQPWRRPLTTVGLRGAGDRFFQRPGNLDDPPLLEGTYFHLDSEHSRHFGHFISQDLTRLWGWHSALEAHPDLKVLVGTRGQPDLPGFQYDLLELAGIDRDRVEVLSAPRRVERLVTATQALQNPRFCAPEAFDAWATIRERVLAGPKQPTPERIFIGRGKGFGRNCHNALEVEQVFVDAGYAVVMPETLPVAEQVRLFAQAKVVAGYSSSALLNQVFAPAALDQIVIASESFTSFPEYLVSSVRGDRLHYFWCPADVQHPPGQWSKEAFGSDFTFDFDRDGSQLRRRAETAGR